MINTNNDVDVPKVLFIACADSARAIDKTTFDSCVVQGVQVTFWEEESEDSSERIDRMFDALFEEVIKTRGNMG